MSALRAAKHALRREMKRRVAALSPDEKRRQSRVLSQKVREAGGAKVDTTDTRQRMRESRKAVGE